jgi:small conductance mechanosensitive channel
MPFCAVAPLSAWSDLKDWLDDSGPDIVVAVVVLAVSYWLFRRIFPPIARAAIVRGGHPADQEVERRANTIIAVVVRTVGALVVLVGVATILTEFGVNITAIVAGLGIAGVALGLGAQQFVRDAINGIFLLAEDQYRQGDVVRVADVTGTVEDLSIRRTIIRDIDGVVHSVPNGSITVVSNYTRDFALVNIPVSVAYGEDLAKVETVVSAVGREVANSPRFRGSVIDMPRVAGVESVEGGSVVLTITARTQPSLRWDIATELRRRLADAFVAQGVQVPFATVTTEPAEPAEPGSRKQPEPF